LPTRKDGLVDPDRSRYSDAGIVWLCALYVLEDDATEAERIIQEYRPGSPLGPRTHAGWKAPSWSSGDEGDDDSQFLHLDTGEGS
jgi:hypothetical protein